MIVPVPAATVILLREGAGDGEVLRADVQAVAIRMTQSGLEVAADGGRVYELTDNSLRCVRA